MIASEITSKLPFLYFNIHLIYFSLFLLVTKLKTDLATFLKLFIIKLPYLFHSNNNEVKLLHSDSKNFTKIPQHLSILIVEDAVSEMDVAKIIVWCMCIGIGLVSISDKSGVVKKMTTSLELSIQAEMTKWLHFFNNLEYKYSITSLCNDVSVEPNTTKVILLSPNDGRKFIVSAAKEMSKSSAKCVDVSRKETVTAENLNNFIAKTSGNLVDPELLFRFGTGSSLFGHLPWHLRLTQFVYMSSHKNIKWQDFYSKLMLYCSTEQRFGK